MKCSVINKAISSYVDGELASEERELFLAHVAGCPECRKELEETEFVHHLFTSAERFDAPPGFATRVTAHIDDMEQAPSSFWSFFTLQPAFLRVAEVAFALAVFMIGMLSGDLLVAGRTPGVEPTVQESFSLDLFQAAPPDSIGGVYMRLAEVPDER